MKLLPTRAAALTLLADFTARAGRDYAETRNFDHGVGDRRNVSMLSRYLRYRLITEAEVVAAVRVRHSGEGAAKFIHEVLWRTYWKGWLELRPSIWDDYVNDLARLEAQPGGWRRDYARALAGGTGIDCFDAWIGELAEHGYLHNHARMWFASIWIFTLRLPWQLGAALFWQQLYDGDPASNTLSWRWVAGLQTIGKTYLARADNIARYTDGRFIATGLATSAVAIAGPPIPPARGLAEPEPLPAGRVGLLLSEDDLAPETLALGATQVAAVASLGGQYGRAANVESFVVDALGDACMRASAVFGVDAVALGEGTAAAISDWARRHRLDQIVTPHPPVGPTATLLAVLTGELAVEGIRLTRRRREWDSRTWPHAQRGFFAFRERVESIA